MRNEPFTIRKRLRSFKYAANGIYLLISLEHNAWIHCFAAICVTIAGIMVRLSAAEWIAIILSIGMVLAAEAVNSSIERLADFVTEEQRDAIKQTKDLAAGSVLILAIAAAAVGLIIFIPKLF